MKTVQELIRDADSLNKFMATNHETQNHLLQTINDEYAQDVYLTLLMSVAETAGQFDETKDNPLAYVCKIAAALDKTPDMQEILRRSLILDEKVLNDYTVTLKQHNLQNMVLFDALTMQILYAKDVAQMSEYIAGLANVFGTGTDGLSEVLLIVKAVINQQTDFKHKFSHITLEKDFLPLLRRHVKNIFIESPDVFFADFETLTDCTEKIHYYFSWKNMKLIHFRNVYLHDTIYTFIVRDTEVVEFEDCNFTKIFANALIKEFGKNGNRFFIPDDLRFLNCERCVKVSFVNCKFSDNIGNFIDYRDGTEYFFAEYDDRGLLVWVDEIKEIVVRDCEFKNCFFREMFPNATYGLYNDKGNFMTFSEKFRPNNFTFYEYIERARVDLNRGSIISGRAEIINYADNTVINSFEV